MEINIEKYDILTLDNDIRYVVASILNHKNIDYYLLVEEKNPKSTMYCYLENGKLVQVEDKKLIELLSLKLAKELFS
jgi:hypothetical protein